MRQGPTPVRCSGGMLRRPMGVAALVVWSCLSIVGCGGTTAIPAAPSAMPTGSSTSLPFPPPAPPGTKRALTGQVTGIGNVPVAGAKVVVFAVGWSGGTTTEGVAITDGDGFYSLPEVSAYAGGDPVGWLLIGASKPGSFADFKWWLDFPKDADLNLRLDPLTPIRVGDAIRGQIGDAECAGLGYGGWYGERAPCQRFAVTVLTSGTLEVSVSAVVSDFDIDIVAPDGTFAAYDGYPYPSGSPRVAIPVIAGSTYQIRLAGARRDFELTAVMR